MVELDSEDYYFNEDGLMVFTDKYLKKRGYCCESSCKHCPYGFNDQLFWGVDIFLNEDYQNLIYCR